MGPWKTPPTFTPRLQRSIFSPLVISSLQSWGRGLSMKGRSYCNPTAHRCRDPTQMQVRVSTQCLAAQQDHGMHHGSWCTDSNRHLDQNSPHWLYSLNLWENICTVALAFYHKPSGISKKKNKGMNSHSLMGADNDNWKPHKPVWRHKHAGSSVSC